MNSVLLTSNEEIIAEIREMIKNIEDIKYNVNMFSEMVKEKVST